MTRPLVHIFRLLRWGRILARHGALRAIEKAPAIPPSVRRQCRIARLGSFPPAVPDYAAAFQAIGPTAVKFGQTLATRPDLVGEQATRNLLLLQDALPPLPFAVIRATVEAALGKPLEDCYARFDPEPAGSASIAQVHRAVTLDGRDVAVKVRRDDIDRQLARDIETYEWAAAHLEALGDEAARLRPRLVVANFKRWTLRELDFRREAAAASELAEAMTHDSDFHIPVVDWDRTSSRVLTLDWVDGIKISERERLLEAGHDLPLLAANLVQSFLRQAIVEGFFHADMHHGNLFVCEDGRIAAVDFGIMGRIDYRARVWLAEILYGLTTGNYRRVAEIHFEAQYVPAHHNIADFASALRAVGEPMRGKPVNELSVGRMLESLFAITRDFDMETQPHLLLLQKTMVMVEGVATLLDPEINMWEVSGPFVKEWIRDELGPEAAIADALRRQSRTLALIPDLIHRLDEQLPRKGAAPPSPRLPNVPLIWEKRTQRWSSHAMTALIFAAIGAAAMWVTMIGFAR